MSGSEAATFPPTLDLAFSSHRAEKDLQCVIFLPAFAEFRCTRVSLACLAVADNSCGGRA